MKNILLHELTLDELTERVSDKVVEKVRPLFPSKENQEYITRQETAKFLRISLPTLRAWTISGRLKSYRIGSRVRYRKSEVIASLKELPFRS